MVGYHKFLSLTLQRWSRFVLVQNLSPLTPKEALETYFRQYGPVEGVRLIHNPESGCYTRKALVLMKSQFAAARIIHEKRHPIGPEGRCITTVNYRGSVSKFNKGRFKVFVMLQLPLVQKSVETRTKMAIHLTSELARAYHGLLYTSIKLVVNDDDYYSGLATVRFEYENDKARVLARTEENHDVVALWTDTKAKDYCAAECREKVVSEFQKKVFNSDWDWDSDLDDKLEDWP